MPLSLQSMQPVLWPLLPQQLPPQQVPDEHWEDDEQAPPSDFLATHFDAALITTFMAVAKLSHCASATYKNVFA